MADEQLCKSIKKKCGNSKDTLIGKLFDDIVKKKECECTPFERAIQTLKTWKCSEVVKACEMYGLMNAMDVEMQECEEVSTPPASPTVIRTSPDSVVPPVVKRAPPRKFVAKK